MLAIDPSRAVTLQHFVQHALKYGCYAEARRWVESVLAVDRDFYPARAARASVLVLVGDTAGARAEVAQRPDVPQLAVVSAVAREALAIAALDSAAARSRLPALRASIPAGLGLTPAAYTALLVMAATGDAEAVLSLLEAGSPRGAFLRYFMAMRPFDPIRGEPRFARLFRNLAP